VGIWGKEERKGDVLRQLFSFLWGNPAAPLSWACVAPQAGKLSISAINRHNHAADVQVRARTVGTCRSEAAAPAGQDVL